MVLIPWQNILVHFRRNERMVCNFAGRKIYCLNALLQNVTRLTVRLAVYAGTIAVLYKYYTSGLKLSCSNTTINLIIVFTLPFWGSLPGKDEYCRLCHSVLTGSGGRRASKCGTQADGT